MKCNGQMSPAFWAAQENKPNTLLFLMEENLGCSGTDDIGRGLMMLTAMHVKFNQKQANKFIDLSIKNNLDWLSVNQLNRGFLEVALSKKATTLFVAATNKWFELKKTKDITAGDRFFGP